MGVCSDNVDGKRKNHVSPGESKENTELNNSLNASDINNYTKKSKKDEREKKDESYNADGQKKINDTNKKDNKVDNINEERKKQKTNKKINKNINKIDYENKHCENSKGKKSELKDKNINEENKVFQVNNYDNEESNSNILDKTGKVKINQITKSELMTGHKPVPINLIVKVMKSICKIRVSKKEELAHGTGFFLNYTDKIKYLITCYHVINPEVENIEIEIWNKKIMKLKLKNRYAIMAIIIAPPLIFPKTMGCND